MFLPFWGEVGWEGRWPPATQFQRFIIKTYSTSTCQLEKFFPIFFILFVTVLHLSFLLFLLFSFNFILIFLVLWGRQLRSLKISPNQLPITRPMCLTGNRKLMSTVCKKTSSAAYTDPTVFSSNWPVMLLKVSSFVRLEPCIPPPGPFLVHTSAVPCKEETYSEL